MQTLNAPRTYTITLPYGSGEPTPREHRGDEARVRAEMRDAQHTAQDTLSRSEKWESGWTFDLDPSPNRVVRTSGEGEDQQIVVAEADGDMDTPKSLTTANGDRHSMSAQFENGEVVSMTGFLKSDEGGTEEFSIKVNPDNGTLTYTVTETGDMISEPAAFLSSSGPDDVYDEWDNSRGGSGPDHVYDEWDNGRGYYFDGPDGRTSYDPYH